ncbi:hypothetical protein UPYG_G00056400 [Umbra pygmaea]|uniref:DNA 3'-5' helicase n=1 Tax=Umbra pygmaea TaxID=75934 RepID=A0ABD0XXU2_UMBPY
MCPAVIYCRTLKAVGRVFCHLKAELGKHCWVDQEHKAENLLIGMFHSQTLPQNKSRVLSSLGGDGACRVVVATTALGMGLNFPNITHVVLYGLPEDVEAILQEVGRAGRDGSQSHAIVYAIKQHTRIDEAVKSLIDKSITSCFRKALFSHFELHTESVKPGHLCCTHCHSVCSCSSDGCDVATPAYELLKQEGSPSGKSREFTQEERVLIRGLLTTYKDSLIQEHTHLYTNRSDCTGFSDDLIDSVLEHSTEIFDVTYIIDNIPVFQKKHAHEVLRIFSEVFCDFEFSDVDLSLEDFLLPDTDYTGYFDEENDGPMEASCSSSESGLSLLRISD